MTKFFLIMTLGLSLSTVHANDFNDHAYTDTSKIFDQTRKEQRKVADEDLAQVRYAIEMTPYELIKVQNDNKSISHKSVPLQTIRKTLKARVGKTNHFFTEDYRLEAVPVSWEPKSKVYDFKLNVFKRLGKYKELEEFITSVDVSGQLIGKNKLFVIDTFAQKIQQDKLGLVSFKIAVRNPESTTNNGLYSDSSSTSKQEAARK